MTNILKRQNERFKYKLFNNLDFWMSEIPYLASNSYKIYYSKSNNGYIIDYYEDNKLPLTGWFKPCMVCCTITSNYSKFPHRSGIYVEINVCKKCIRTKKELFICHLKYKN